MSDDKQIIGGEFDISRYMWYRELHDNNCGLTLAIDKICESTKSEFQTIEVLENETFGKMLVLYGSLMVAEKDNNAYNEMLAHVGLLAHPHPDKVLIIGGGDCGTLTEITRHPEVKEITMCEIDQLVVEVAKRHFPELTAGVDDPRVTMVYDDGQKFINESDQKFDLIILDLSDPIGPAADLFQKEFHQSVYDRLNDDGILIAQSESPYFNQEIVRAMFGNLKSIFPITKMYTCFMPIYPSGFWSFAFCSKKYDPIKDFDQQRYDQLHLKTRYYNDEIHRAAFVLPEFVRDILENK